MAKDPWLEYIKRHIAQDSEGKWGMVPVQGDSVTLACECGGHAIHLAWSVDEEKIYKPSCYLNFGIGQPSSFWQRLKDAWEVFRYGTMCVDEVILFPEDALKLYDFIGKWFRWLKESSSDLRPYFESKLLEE